MVKTKFRNSQPEAITTVDRSIASRMPSQKRQNAIERHRTSYEKARKWCRPMGTIEPPAKRVKSESEERDDPATSTVGTPIPTRRTITRNSPSESEATADHDSTEPCREVDHEVAHEVDPVTSKQAALDAHAAECSIHSLCGWPGSIEDGYAQSNLMELAQQTLVASAFHRSPAGQTIDVRWPRISEFVEELQRRGARTEWTKIVECALEEKVRHLLAKSLLASMEQESELQWLKDEIERMIPAPIAKAAGSVKKTAKAPKATVKSQKKTSRHNIPHTTRQLRSQGGLATVHGLG